MPEAVRREELGLRPGRGDRHPLHPRDLRVLPIVDDERRHRKVGGEARQGERLARRAGARGEPPVQPFPRGGGEGARVREPLEVAAEVGGRRDGSCFSVKRILEAVG